MIQLSTLLMNPNNPRIVRDKDFKLLVKSLKEFPEMLVKRPIVYDENMIVIAGNQRLAALQELGLTEIPDEWAVQATGWTEEQKKEFVIKDNTHAGSWDWEALRSEWSLGLQEWGVPMPATKKEPGDNLINWYLSVNIDTEAKAIELQEELTRRGFEVKMTRRIHKKKAK